jgi:hypothetical protein
MTLVLENHLRRERGQSQRRTSLSVSWLLACCSRSISIALSPLPLRCGSPTRPFIEERVSVSAEVESGKEGDYLLVELLIKLVDGHDEEQYFYTFETVYPASFKDHVSFPVDFERRANSPLPPLRTLPSDIEAPVDQLVDPHRHLNDARALDWSSEDCESEQEREKRKRGPSRSQISLCARRLKCCPLTVLVCRRVSRMCQSLDCIKVVTCRAVKRSNDQRRLSSPTPNLHREAYSESWNSCLTERILLPLLSSTHARCSGQAQG